MLLEKKGNNPRHKTERQKQMGKGDTQKVDRRKQHDKRTKWHGMGG